MVSTPASPGLVQDEAAELALRVELVDVDRGVHDAVLEGGQVAGQLERAGGAHRVADVALGVVDVHTFGESPKTSRTAGTLDVALGRGGGVGADDVDVAGFEARALRARARMHSFWRSGRGSTKSAASEFTW